MLTFGIDWDDVISPLNDCAIELANEEYHFEPPLTLEDIDSWENTGRASVIKKYYSDPRLYEMQRVSDQAKAFSYRIECCVNIQRVIHSFCFPA